MRSTPLLALTLGTSLLAACGGDEDPPAEPQPPAEMTAISYNAGLALGFVEATDARAPLTIERTAALQTDVLCVQELWRDEDVAALTMMTSETLPNASFIDPDPGELGDVACAEGETDDLLTCVTDAGCDQVCPDELASCALANGCGALLGSLSNSCGGCVQANIGNELDDIIEACQSPALPFAYGGSFGIGLLTSYDVLASDELVMDSTTNRRGILYAELDTPFGPVHTFCTHLTAVFSDIPYPGDGSWEEEQAAQIDSLLAFVDEKAGEDGRVMVMGDFNTGPAGDGYIAEVPQNYDLLVGGGLGNPYTLTPGHTCTYCEDNPIIAKDNPDDDSSVVIDHVLIQGFTGGVGTADRVLDDVIEVENCGETISSAYSDHYGVRLTITESE